MAKLHNVVNFLNELNSGSTKLSFISLKEVIEELEEKNDPDQIEMEIVNVGYQLLEKLELMHAVLQKYVKEGHILTGDKLTNLYDKNGSGSSTLFD